MPQLCPIMSFTEVDNTVTFMVSFMNISDQIPSIQVKNKLYWSYQLECWAWRGDLPSAYLTELFPTLCASHAGLLFFELARLMLASEYESLLLLQPWNVLHTTGVYPPHRLSFSLVVPSSKRPSWSTYYSPCNKYHTNLFFFSPITCHLWNYLQSFISWSFVSWFSDHFSSLLSGPLNLNANAGPASLICYLHTAPSTD